MITFFVCALGAILYHANVFDEYDVGLYAGLILGLVWFGWIGAIICGFIGWLVIGTWLYSLNNN